MKKTFVWLSAALISCFVVSCDTLQPITGGMGAPSGTIGNTSTPTGSEITSALKQVLDMGIKQGVKQVSQKDGFFKNALIKILFPPQAQKVEQTLRQIGLGSICDQFILSVNRAAENASKEALPIFVNALKGMSFSDASQILLGSDTAATHYFRTKTTNELAGKFQPVISQSLHQVDATKYWGTITSQYNKLPLVQPINTDLSAYVTQKAIDGLFKMVAQKEIQVRDHIAGRSTPLLKKVFGYADRER